MSVASLFPRGLRGLIFDVDGVLLDSIEANRFFYNKLLAGLGLPPMTVEQENYAFMATVQAAMTKMTPPEMYSRLPEYITTGVDYVAEVLPRIKLMPGVREFIWTAHDLGLFLAIDTNRTNFGIERVLDFFSLPTYIKPVISSSIAEPKPSPQGPLLICEDWKVQPEQALFIGDSEDDRKAAMGAGTRFAAFGDKGLAGDIRAPDFKSLGELIWPLVEKAPKAR